MSIDFRQCLAAISDVIINRPPPLRVFDQIYMKLPDMMLQTELIGRWFDGRRALFVGDGDAIALCCVHLHAKELLKGGPQSAHVLDFDERVVNSVRQFAHRYDLEDRITAELYNVADRLPEELWGQFDAFYTNPPWGQHNGGESVRTFLNRGVEGLGGNGLGCVVIGDHPEYPWTQDVLQEAQRFLADRSFWVAEMLPRFHHYHLDDAPELTSCSLIVRRFEDDCGDYASEPVSPASLANFYGREQPLRIHYVRDLRRGGKAETRDIELEEYPRDAQ